MIGHEAGRRGRPQDDADFLGERGRPGRRGGLAGAEAELLERVEQVVDGARAGSARRCSARAGPCRRPRRTSSGCGWATHDHASSPRPATQAGISVRPFAGEGARVSIGERAANDAFLAVASAFPHRRARPPTGASASAQRDFVLLGDVGAERGQPLRRRGVAAVDQVAGRDDGLALGGEARPGSARCRSAGRARRPRRPCSARRPVHDRRRCRRPRPSRPSCSARRPACTGRRRWSRGCSWCRRPGSSAP